MSLINQALKKTQRDRGPADRHGATGGAPGDAGSDRTRALPPGLLIGLVALFALLIGLVAGLTLVVLRGDRPPPDTRRAEAAPAANPAAPGAAETAAPETGSATPAQRPAAATENPPTGTADSGETAPRTPAAILRELRAARETAEAEAGAAAEGDSASATETEAAGDGKAGPTGEASPESKARAVEWLSKANINAVRLSADGGRALINGNTYSAGETVHYGLGLRILVIEENRILFADSEGRKYLKRH